MSNRDSKVDAYINKSADFAQPILRHLRELIHSACPDVEEAIKWRNPSYEYRGILCITAAFKHHCALVFWDRSIREALKAAKKKEGWGPLGKITALSDLPKDAVLTRYIKEAVKINESGKKRAATRPSKGRLVVPTYIRKMLAKNKKALAKFEGLSPSHQREYVEWIVEAKREETRDKRLATMMQRLIEGKSLNWKYEK